MRRKPIDPSDPSRWASLTLLFLGLLSCTLAYTVISYLLGPRSSATDDETGNNVRRYALGSGVGYGKGCCRGIPNLELWGSAVKWGSEFKLNSSEACCKACKDMCSGNHGPCLCDSWVFCGNKKACGSKFGECWLKKQKDSLAPEKQDAGDNVIWTSGLVFGKGQGIIGLQTEHGTLHVKLYPDCAPHSVAYILDLMSIRHCAGCHLYRAESRGSSWDSKGNHIADTSYGPPYALIQGTLEAQGFEFKEIPAEVCPTVARGAVAWIDSGPEFFVSLANHHEWKGRYTVFGSVLPEDMEVAEKIARLPTNTEVWNNINVSVLQKPVSLSLHGVVK